MSNVESSPEPQPVRYAVVGGVYNNYFPCQRCSTMPSGAQRGRKRSAWATWAGSRTAPTACSHPSRPPRGGDAGQLRSLDRPSCPTAPAATPTRRDNHYTHARLSYAYTQAKTSARHPAVLRALPPALRRGGATCRLLMAHGSPRRVNEFLWESQCSDAFLRRLLANTRRMCCW